MSEPVPNAYGERIARVEAATAQLNASLNELHSELGSVKRDVANGFSTIAAKLETNSRTDWRTIFSGISVLVAIVVPVFIAFIRPLELQTAYTSGRVDALASQVKDISDTVIRHDERINSLREQRRVPD